MIKPLNYGAICGRIFAAIPKPTAQQVAMMLDNLDGITESELLEYAAHAGELAKTPLDRCEEKVLLSLSQQLALVSTGQPGVMNFNTKAADRLAADLKHLTETDC